MYFIYYFRQCGFLKSFCQSMIYKSDQRLTIYYFVYLSSQLLENM